MEECKIMGSKLEFPNSSLIDLRRSPLKQDFWKSPQKQLDNFCFLTPPLTDEAMVPTIRVPDTPCSHRTKPENSLPYDFKTKCIIYCDTSPQPVSQISGCEGSIKRCRTDRLLTPNKKIKPLVRLPLKAEEISQEQKENSPIKIEIETETHAIYSNKALNFCSLTLKQPPIKIAPYVFRKGETSCDILSNLAKKGMLHVLQRIFSYLAPIDIVTLQSVSSHYNIILTQAVPRENLGVARAKVLRSKENIGVKPTPIVRFKNETTPKKLLRVNKLQSPKRRAPLAIQLSPSSKRFQYYLQTAKTLDKTERLEKCPRCCYPAKRNELVLVATCSGCNYTFCVQCRSNPHINKVCNFFIPSPESPDSRHSRHWGVGTKANKKALRRL